MTSTVHKVTCFITRHHGSLLQVLLFNHPDVGIQIPSGTVERGEEVESAARREACEETGLNNLVLLRLLNQTNDPPPPGFLVVAIQTPVYSYPHLESMDWAHFRLGTPVEVLRNEQGFTQVRYEETDRYIDPQYVRYYITGWVPDEALTSQRIRYFYLFEVTDPTPESWSVAVDYTIFELFWAPLNALPPIIQPQEWWLKYLLDMD